MISRRHHRQALAAAIALALIGLPESAAAQSASRALAVHAIAPDAVQALRGDASLLLLGSGAIDPLREHLDFAQGRAASTADSRYGIVQFNTGQQQAVRDALAAAGIEIVGFLPNNAFQIRAGSTAMTRVARLPQVRWSAAYPAGFKLAPALLDGSAVAQHAPSATITLQVHGFRGESAERLADTLRASGLALRVGTRSASLDLPTFRVDVHPAQLDAVLVAASGIDGVAWIEPYLAPQLHNRDIIGPIQSNQPSCATPDNSGNCASGLDPLRATLWQRGLTGHGQLVAIADSGLDHNEDWFTGLDLGDGANIAVTEADDPAPTPPATGTTHPDNKIYGYWVQPGASAYDNNEYCGGYIRFHGTHVTGTAVGDAPPYTAPGGVDYINGGGMAPGAQVLFQDIGNDTSGCLAIEDFAATLAQAHAAGAGVHSNSWGSPSAGAYSGQDQETDAHQWATENTLVVFSAGNHGPGTGTTGSPGNAKNVLTVGATRHGHLPAVTSFSSRGPTLDGRRKPDIMAPGEMIVSALGNTDDGSTIQTGTTQTLSGTSMATPAVSGGAALVRQYFSDGWYPHGRPTAGEEFSPSGSLLKAVLLNGTAPISTNWPSNNVGWGRLWLDNSLYFGGQRRALRQWVRDNGAGLETGDADEFTVDIATGGELRATLAWFDPEAALTSAAALVNDLDLIAIAPDGTEYAGNDFYAAQSRADGSADRLNSAELIRRIAPEPGTWRFRVVAHDVPGNGRPTSHRQGYALVVAAAMPVLGNRLFVDDFDSTDDLGSPTPTTAILASNDTAGIRIESDAVTDATGYQLYRADGSCATADRGVFRFVAQDTLPSLVDTHTQGGASYAYRMRAIRDGVEGPLSDACVDVLSNDECSMSFGFDTGSLAADARHATCAANLTWQPATPNCPGETIHYRVLRDASPLFTAPVELADSDSVGFDDTTVANGEPVYYQVEARNDTGFVKRSNIVGVTPSGMGDAGPGVLIDDADTRTTLALAEDWSITNAAASNGDFSYRSAVGMLYRSNTCSAATTQAIRLAPGTPQLRYAARYQVEVDWDGVVVELSDDDGATWTPITPDGGYPGSFAMTQDPPVNACGYPTTQGAFNGESAGFASGAFVEHSHDLSAWAGQDVLVRWRLSTDAGLEQSGFFLDDVRIDAQLPDQCTASP